jgi:hypothetical protein
MSDEAKGTKNEDLAPDRPRLTPQGHGSASVRGEDSTDPNGGVKPETRRLGSGSSAS